MSPSEKLQKARPGSSPSLRHWTAPLLAQAADHVLGPERGRP